MRIALADDQVLFVDSLKTVLEYAAADLEVCGIAFDGRQAIELVKTQKPEVILMDVRMPEMDGVEATRIIRNEYPDTNVVMLTTFDDDEYVYSALSYGALGYLLKNIPTEELVASLRAIRAGTMQISPSVARKLIERGSAPAELGEEVEARPDAGRSAETARKEVAVASSTPESAGVQESSWRGRLSERELEVLRLLAKGFPNKEIASALSISEQTVKNHLSAVYTKMGVSSRLEAFQRLTESDTVQP